MTDPERAEVEREIAALREEVKAADEARHFAVKDVGENYLVWRRRVDELEARVKVFSRQLTVQEQRTGEWHEEADKQKARAEAAEAERDTLRAQIAQLVERLREPVWRGAYKYPADLLAALLAPVPAVRENKPAQMGG